MKKKKTVRYETEEQKEVKKFIFVLLGLIIIVVGVYFFTRAFVTKDLFNTNEVTYQEGKINYDVAIVGNMLTRPEKDYYVFAFSNESTKVNYYNTLVNLYTKEENSLKIYHVDLENELNKKYVATDNAVSTSFDTMKNLKLGEVTLIKVQDQKVTKYLTNIEDIKKELNI